ncbi:sugar ABC transporter permease [Actinocatenispora thailandica]|uniref:Sugar ABC transporter permease n=1 Tax=Actinocatenispora thailandica TaxID=227318 RepID=A0A7R7DTM5_9ACTN|nr:sugar ABC transporter permease [Actinocatenispora thailandica]BCJ37617.1 sugar ABC transporter permease [Actinocatenispora thailandica]
MTEDGETRPPREETGTAGAGIPEPAAGTVAAAGGAEPAARGAHRAALSEGRRSERRLGWLLCLPAAVVMVVVTIYPIVYALLLSFQRADLRFPSDNKWIGLTNYVTVLTNSFWWHAFAITMIVTVVSVAVELVLGMALAMIMHRTLLGRGLVRTLALIPYGIVTVVAAYGWRYAWTPGYGYLANVLAHNSAPLTQQAPAVGIIILAEIWKTTPFMALLLMAGLAIVPDDLQRAASMDGATTWQRFTQVTLPLMKPAILVALLFRTLDAVRIYDNIYVLTNGAQGTSSLSILTYHNLIGGLNLGIGSTMSILMFIAVAIIAFIFIKGFGTAAPGSDATGRR